MYCRGWAGSSYWQSVKIVGSNAVTRRVGCPACGSSRDCTSEWVSWSLHSSHFSANQSPHLRLAADVDGARGLAGLCPSIARLKLSELLVLRCLSFPFESLRLLAMGIAELRLGDDGVEDELAAVTIAVAEEAEAGTAAALRLMRRMGLRLLQGEGNLVRRAASSGASFRPEQSRTSR